MGETLLKKLNWFCGFLAVAVLFGLISLVANLEIRDVDLWLHLAAGRHILDTFSIPRTDIFSCTIAGQPWIDHEWLFQVVLQSIYHPFGISGLNVLKAILIILPFVCLLYFGYSRNISFLTLLSLLLVLLVYLQRLTLRADTVSVIFFILFLVVPKTDKKALWIFGFLQVLWVNIHGFFVIGPLVLLFCVIGEWLKKHLKLIFEWNKTQRLSDEAYRRLKQVLGVTVCACLVNPYFWKGAWYPFGVIFSLPDSSGVFFRRILDLQGPLAAGSLLSIDHFSAYKLLVIISGVGFLKRIRKIDVSLLLIWAMFLIMSAAASRNIVYFAIIAYFSIIVNYRLLDEPSETGHAKWKLGVAAALKICLIIWIAGYFQKALPKGYYDFDRHQRKSIWGGMSLRNFPSKAADFLVENDIKGNFFNDFNSGAYLLGRTYPNIKVFIDGRTEVYGAGHFRLYDAIWKGDEAKFQSAQRQYGITGAFLNSVYVPAPAKFIKNLYDHDGWALVYFDYDAAIFLKDIPQNRAWINKFEIDLNNWTTPVIDKTRIGTQKVTPYRHINRGYALLNMGFREKAAAEAAEALRIDPGNAKALEILGEADRETGNR